MRLTMLLFAGTVALSVSGAEHNRLLPRPQRITYGSGRLRGAARGQHVHPHKHRAGVTLRTTRVHHEGAAQRKKAP